MRFNEDLMESDGVFHDDWELMVVEWWKLKQKGPQMAYCSISRSILDGYFNPLVFWYQWKYLLTSKEFIIFLQGI